LGFTVQIFTVGSLVRALGNAVATRQLLDYDGIDGKDDTTGFQDVFTLPLAHNIVRCIQTNLLGATKEVSMILKNTAAGNRTMDKENLTNSLEAQLLRLSLINMENYHLLHYFRLHQKMASWNHDP